MKLCLIFNVNDKASLTSGNTKQLTHSTLLITFAQFIQHTYGIWIRKKTCHQNRLFSCRKRHIWKPFKCYENIRSTFERVSTMLWSSLRIVHYKLSIFGKIEKKICAFYATGSCWVRPARFLEDLDVNKNTFLI